ncbi:MAG: hypothetical protein JO057_15720 [Chloroflexi bacterium]|nr:hypothetical protein [Chloroflexota bacterium]
MSLPHCRFVDAARVRGVGGFIGEVGWPDNTDGDAEQWNALAEAWYAAADRAGLWVSAWATGEWWDPAYKLAVYRKSASASGLDTANTQACVLEQHATRSACLRGIAVAGGSFASPTVEPSVEFSDSSPGNYDVDYHYDGDASFGYVAQRGIRLARLDFRWERSSPRSGRRWTKPSCIAWRASRRHTRGTRRPVRRSVATSERPLRGQPRCRGVRAHERNGGHPAGLPGSRGVSPAVDASSEAGHADNNGPEILSRDPTLTHGSPFALRISRTFPSEPAYGHLRVVTDGGGSPRDLSASGDTLAGSGDTLAGTPLHLRRPHRI